MCYLESNWTFIYISSKPTCDKPKAEGLRASEASARAKRAALKRSVPIPNWSHAEGPYMYPSQSEQLPKYIG